MIELRGDQSTREIVEIMDHNGMPFAKRLVVQFSEILKTNGINIDQTKQASITTILMDATNEFNHLEEILKSYIEAEEVYQQSIISGDGYKYEENAYRYKDISPTLNRMFKDFLIQAVIIYRKIMKIAELFYGKKISSDHKKLKKKLDEDFPCENIAYNSFSSLLPWIKELYDMRGLAEHGDIDISKIRINKFTTNISVEFPKLTEKDVYLRNYMIEGIEKLLLFCEDFIASLLSRHIHQGLSLIKYDVPGTADKFRYVIDIRPSV